MWSLTSQVNVWRNRKTKIDSVEAFQDSNIWRQAQIKLEALPPALTVNIRRAGKQRGAR
jgi:hypothetical protein